jgi:ATP-dependent Lhr-like helicase
MPQGTQVVYVSPLKALSNDIRKNLEEPLAGISALAEKQGTPLPEIRVAVRTGDTTPSERQAMLRKPPHILITTPESLFILLTSKKGRQMLSSVRTLILDEIHAVVDDKRGAHLALTVERLCALAQEPVTRIGLSATVRPLEGVARFLVGSQNISPGGAPDCLVVDAGHARAMDLALEVPGLELGPIATHEHWAQVLDRIAQLAQEHRTTLVFVNTRRLVERVAHQLGERMGQEAVVAHHGSLSRRTRHAAEERLKAGEVKVCVATASLELGIDIGAVDLACQIGSPRSISLLLQRIGRSGHSPSPSSGQGLGAVPKGRLFPLTRDEMLECIALLRAVKKGRLDQLNIPPWPLDVLAQQIVAACASEDWDEQQLFDLCHRAYPYRELPRERFDQVVAMLSEGVALSLGRGSAYLHRDAVNGKLRGRLGARLAAITSGGAIPDTADYAVIAEPEEVFVGTVNEDFAVESLAGDVFLLGNTPWRIRRVERDTVRVEDAHGATPSVPFWLGEAPARTLELSQEVSELREDLDARLDSPEDATTWLVQEHPGVGREAAEQAVAYLREGKLVLGMVPTQRRVVAERFFDEAGGMQLVLHAPFGARINRAWGFALRKQLCRTFDFELQAAATDDGVNISLGPQHSFPLGDLFQFLSLRTIEEVLQQAVLQSPLFTTRWRWNASRALAVLRQQGGRKVPMALQRMKSDDLLAAVFPAQVACQDNAAPGNIPLPDHPLVFETMRDCLTEALDTQGLKEVLEAIEGGEIEVYARETPQPSAFSHQLLNTMPYAFLDDAPLEERRSRAVALRRALPESARDLGTLDPEAITAAAQQAWPVVRNAEDLHDALLSLGMLPEDDIGRGPGGATGELWEQWFAHLVQERRAVTARFSSGRHAWVATEKALLVAAAFPDVQFNPAPAQVPSQPVQPSEEDAIEALVRGRVECSGPFTAQVMARVLGLPESSVVMALARLEAAGVVLRGSFTPGRSEEEFCDRRILARIHRATISHLRKEVQPVPPATFLRFLFRWQHVAPDSRLHGEDGLLDAIEQLQGFEAPAEAWEAELLRLRVANYLPSWLDSLCLSGEVVWGRFFQRESRLVGRDGVQPWSAFVRTGPISLALREDLPWLLDQRSPQERPLSGAAQEVLEFLSRRGASFLTDITAGVRRLPSEVEEALWQLVAAGLVAADSFGVLRGRISGMTKRLERAARLRHRPRLRSQSSRWSLLQPPSMDESEEVTEARAWQLLHRYGVVIPELLTRETVAPRWRALLEVYRRAEARGEVRAGRFIGGFLGEQFAMPEAVDLLRDVNRRGPTGELLKLSACDPLNLAGILTPGARVPSVLGNSLVFRDGVPIAALQSGEVLFREEMDEATRKAVMGLLQPAVGPSSPPTANGARAALVAWSSTLRRQP